MYGAPQKQSVHILFHVDSFDTENSDAECKLWQIYRKIVLV